LGFEIWNLTPFILETKIRLYQYEFCIFDVGHNTKRGSKNPIP
jgi:hypothetical protein